MATVTKNFKVKSGLIVEGATATVGGQDVLTKKQDDQDYIVGLIGGTSTSANTANSVVKRDGNGNFAAGTITADLVGDVTGNADTATTLETSRKIELVGDVTGEVMFDGSQNVQITATLDGDFATDAEVATAKGEAITAAETYTNNREAAITTAYETYANAAEQDAKDYADALINDGSNLSTEVWSAYKTSTEIGLAQAAAQSYADGKVADLVDGAPALLDTLNELAAAIADNPNYATDVANLVAGKQDTLTAGSNIDITGSTISVTGLDSTDISDFNAAALSATAAAYDIAGAASSAQTAAEGYASGLDSATNTRIDNLSTSNVAEGTNLYYTDARAKAEAATLLANATKTNIVITKDGSNNLTITAENGVADSTTNDLAEGTGPGANLYFTDARAVSALEAVVPNFTEVELNSVSKQIAATTSVATASAATAYSWAKADYRSGKFLVKVASGSHTDVSEVLVTLDTSDNVAITEYAMVGTNGALSTISADVSGSNVRLIVTTANNNSTVVVAGTLI